MLSLVPLISLPERLLPGTAPAGLLGAVPLTLSSAVLPMKALLSTAALALCVLGWFVFQRPAAPGSSTDLERMDGSELVIVEPGSSDASGPPGRGLESPATEQRETAGAAADGSEPAQAKGPWLAGTVVDDGGMPIEGAVLYLMELGPDSARAEASGDLRTESQLRGEFTFDPAALGSWLEDRDGAFAMGVVANGFLRQTITDVPVCEFDLEIVLRRGDSLQGRVTDREGRGIPGLRLLAHGNFPGGNHVSPSRVLRRGNARNLAGPDSPYHQSLALSGNRGDVEFSGLAAGTYTVRSLDPGWVIVEPTGGRAGDSGVTWVAEERFGIRVIAMVEGVDARNLKPERRPELRATFRVEVELEGGGTIDTGQWVGSGSGSATFSLMEDADPRIDMAKVRTARFYGTARVGGEEKEWSAEPQVRGSRRKQASQVFVDFGAPALTGEAKGSMWRRDSAIELDVRYGVSGAPFSGSLGVEWLSRRPDGTTTKASDRAVRLENGRYRIELPSGKVELRVSEGWASGSLAPFEGMAECLPGQTATVFVELAQGSAVKVARPDASEGEWFLRASYRTDENAAWFGSWNYSTDEDTLRLTALKPAEWRFELRVARGEEPLAVRIVTVEEGQELEVR